MMKSYSYCAHGYFSIHLFLSNGYSDPWNVLQSVENPIPSPSATQVLIRVHVVALNPGSYITMKYFPSIMVKKPAIPETDVSGIIVSVGADVKQWKIGDKVYGIIPAWDMIRKRQGGLTEYTLLQEENMYF